MIAPMISLRGRDFIDVADLAPGDLRRLLDLAHQIKAGGWTDRPHPFQVRADPMTLAELRGDVSRQHLVYIGDGNNIANSLIEASSVVGLTLTVVTPPGYDPVPSIVERARSINPGKNHVTLTTSSMCTKQPPSTPTSGPPWERKTSGPPARRSSAPSRSTPG